MLVTFIAILAIAAPTSPEQQALLKTFREEFVAITPGEGQFPKSFLMGSANGGESEQPAHRVALDYQFQIGANEVPQNLWHAVLGKNPSRWQGPRNSVEMVSFDEAQAFCRRATELMRANKLIKPNQVIRLPTEAEWEYVARAGTRGRYSFGDVAGDNVEGGLSDYAWFTGNAAGNDPAVGAKKPNPWKLYDIHGYLWEWTADPVHENYTDAPVDGQIWSKRGNAKKRIVRGGSWTSTAAQCTSSFRLPLAKETRRPDLGLRCVLATENPPKQK